MSSTDDTTGSQRPYYGIGDVLSLLKEDFPDITISKIRFLESQGLFEPERTPSGFRKFYDEDIEKLSWILRQQREHFLPLRVIKERLKSGQLNNDDDLSKKRKRTQATNNNVFLPLVPHEDPLFSDSEDERDALATVDVHKGHPVNTLTAQQKIVPISPEFADSAYDDHPRTDDIRDVISVIQPVEKSEPQTDNGNLDNSTFEKDNNTVNADNSRHSTSSHLGKATSATKDSAAIESTTKETPVTFSTDSELQITELASRISSSKEPATTYLANAPSLVPSADAPDVENLDSDGFEQSFDSPLDKIKATDDLARYLNIPVSDVVEMEEYGLIVPERFGLSAKYSEEDIEIAKLIISFSKFGFGPRHLKILVHSAEREAGLYIQAIAPIARRKSPESKNQLKSLMRDLSKLSAKAHQIFLKRALKAYFKR